MSRLPDGAHGHSNAARLCRPPPLPATISSRLKEFWPALLLAMQVYMPASRLVTGSMTKECTPFSLTSILWAESGRMVCPFSCQTRSGVGRPLTCKQQKLD